MVLVVRLEDKGAFRSAAAQLKSMDKSLTRDLQLVLRREVQPVMAKQRALVRSMPVKGLSGSSGLRRAAARSVKLKLAAVSKPQMRIVTTMSDAALAFAPRGLDTRFRGWRAPLFGNRHSWHQHKMTGPSWFIGPASEAQPRVQIAVIRTLNSTAEEISTKATRLRG